MCKLSTRTTVVAAMNPRAAGHDLASPLLSRFDMVPPPPLLPQCPVPPQARVGAAPPVAPSRFDGGGAPPRPCPAAAASGPCAAQLCRSFGRGGPA